MFIPTIGLEIHAELQTRTKMFCDSLSAGGGSALGGNDSTIEHHPNTNVCPVCLGHPGTLPTINKQAVEHVIKVGLALGGKINPVTKFDRKNYFYPDLPKGYQISQYDQPLVVGGELNGARITRIHLEEDTGTLVHDQRGPSASSGRPASLVDFNRAGVPLMELVTEPDIKSADEAVAFARELQLILRYLGVSDADMERGQMRIEANVSLMPTNVGTNPTNDISEIRDDIRADSRVLGAKVELKNINSFRFAKEAIEYEIKRQIEALEAGEKIKQETRGWDENKKKTVSQRSKEEAHDYRYFPEPDLPPLETSVFDPEHLKIELPELPAAKRKRFASEYKLDPKQIDVFVEDQKFAEFFEESASELRAQTPTSNLQLLTNYLVSDLRGLMNEVGIGFEELSAEGGSASGGKIDPEHIAHLVALIEKGTIGSRQAKDVLRKMFESGADPEEIVKSEGLETVFDEAELEKVVKQILEENPSAVSDYKNGKSQALQFLVGKAMAKLRGRGNPEKLKELILSFLE